MMIDRRKALKLVGGGVVIAAASTAGYIGSRTPTNALSPWETAGNYSDIRLFALSYAILSPNPHNRQPWQAELVDDNRLRIFRDLSKNLTETDPYDRQLTIGMGCFLETLELSANQRGYNCAIELFPAATDEHVADITFSEKSDALQDNTFFNALLKRRSCKEPFYQQTLSAEHADKLSQYGTVYLDQHNVEKLKRISWDAYKVEYETHRTLKESVDLMRFGKAEINRNPDGIDMGGPMLETLHRFGMLTPESLMDKTSTAYQQGLEMYANILSNTPAYILIKTKDNSRLSQIAAGRQWMRLNLEAANLGVALHPVSQALQEYEEMNSIYETIHAEFAKTGETIQMFGRLGYGPTTQPSPRWPVEKKLLS